MGHTGVSQKVLVGYVPGREQPSLLYLTADYIFLLNRGICVRGDLVLGYVGLSLLGRVVSATWVYHRGLCYVPAIPTTAKSPPTPLATRHGGEGRALTGYQATLFTDNGAVSQVPVSNVKSAGKKNNILILPPCPESNFTIIKR